MLLGAKQVIAIDRVPERLAMAEAGGAITINFEKESVLERLNELTQARARRSASMPSGWRRTPRRRSTHVRPGEAGADAGNGSAARFARDDLCLPPRGQISVPGVYGGLLDKFPFGMAMNKGLTFRMGQTHVNRWTDDLLRRIEEGQIDPTFVITHTATGGGAGLYKTFRNKEDGCIKVVLKP